ncbi:MAG: YceD family protein [Thermoflexales bacterium]
MRYRLHKLLYGPVGETQSATLDLGVTTFSDGLQVHFLRGEFHFTRINQGILVQGEVDTAITAQCTRSLDEFELPIHIKLEDLLFTTSSTPTDSPNLRIGEDGWLDLTETLREEIILAIPINPIHPRFRNISAQQLLHELGVADQDWLDIRLDSAGTQPSTLISPEDGGLS